MKNTGLSNIDSEKAVVGALIRDGRTHKYIRQLTPDDFTNESYRTIFKAARDLVADKGSFDLVMLDQSLGNPLLLSEALEAMNATPTGIYTEQHVETLRDLTSRRTVSELCINLYKQIGDLNRDSHEVVLEARKALQGVSTGRIQSWMTMPELLRITLDDLEKRTAGVKKPIESGLRDIDDIIGGFFPGELTIIGARPAVGKSSFGMEIALNAARGGKRVAVCSLEMAPEQYGQRLLSGRSGVDGMKMRLANVDSGDWDAILNATKELESMKAGFTFSVVNIEDLDAAVQRYTEEEKIDLLLLDYIQLMDSKRKHESERLKVGYISWSLKQMAMTYKIPVIALAQLKRPDGGAIERMPTMRDLRESGNMEADADGIILMHQPRKRTEETVYEEDRASFDLWRDKGLRYTIIRVEKQRMGSTGTVSALFDGAHMRYMGIRRGT